MVKILVIEDDLNIRNSLVDLLELKNYKVLSANDGDQGYQKAVEENPDIIISDIMMPGMNGYEILVKLTEINKTRIPFIFLSALSSKEDQKIGLDLGAAKFLVKPFRAQDLFDTIDVILNKS